MRKTTWFLFIDKEYRCSYNKNIVYLFLFEYSFKNFAIVFLVHVGRRGVSLGALRALKAREKRRVQRSEAAVDPQEAAQPRLTCHPEILQPPAKSYVD